MITHRTLAKIFYKPFPQIVWRMPPVENKIYLTFDDGPYPPVTKPLLEYLNAQKIPAAFFLSGETVFRFRHQIAPLEYAGHAIGNHSFHHVPMFGLSKKTLLREVNAADAVIQRYLKQNARLFRPPYGMFDKRISPVLRATGKKMILWSLMANDFKWDKSRILSYLQRSVMPGDIIVFHDSPMTEKVLLPVLETFVSHCRERGWGFGQLGQ